MENLTPEEKGWLLLGALGNDDAVSAAQWLESAGPALEASNISALGKACEWGASRCVELLLAKGEPWDVADESKLSPIERAAAGGFERCVELCAARASPAQHGALVAALSVAFEKKRMASAKFLMGCLDWQRQERAVQAQALKGAICAKAAWAVEELLSSGVDKNLRLDAVDCGMELRRGVGNCGFAGFNKKIDESNLSTPALLHALGSASWECARCLIEAGADIAAKRVGGVTALMLAAKGQSAPTVKALLEKGAWVGELDESGRCALMWASGYENGEGNERVTRMLLARGSDALRRPLRRWPAAAHPCALEMFALRYDSKGDVEAICEFFDPSEAIEKLPMENVESDAACALMAGKKAWQAKAQAKEIESSMRAPVSFAGTSLGISKSRL